MSHKDAYLKRMRESNDTQLDYIRDKLHRFADSLTDDLTGEFEIRVPFLRGTLGQVSVIVTERQPKGTQ